VILMLIYTGFTDDQAETVFDACVAIADRIHTMLAVSNGQIPAGIHARITR
jgi:hypothetical protein